MDTPSEKQNKRRGLIGTIVFHLLLLVIFLFTGLTIPVPLPEEKSMAVGLLDLGNVEFGSGEEQPMSTEQPNITDPVTQPQETVTEEVEEEVETQEQESDVAMTEKTSDKPVVKEPKLDPRLKKALSNPFKSDQSNDSKGQGNSGQPGDQGSPEGTPGGSGGGGNGISYNLGGRGFKGAPPIQGNMQESGKIVVEIIVDREGNVIRVTPGSRGTTITNAELMKRVMESARRAKFTPKADAPEEQKGTMTFEFILE